MNKVIERIKNNFNKNKMVIIVFLCIWLLAIIATPIIYKDSLGNEPVGNEYYDKVIRLDNNTIVEEIVPVENGATSISITFATYARKNSGKVNVKVVGEDSGIVYADKSFSAFFFQDNASKTIGLKQKLSSSTDERIIIQLSSTSDESKSIGVYISKDSYFNNSELREYGFHIDGDLSFKYLIENEDLSIMCKSIIIYSTIGLTLLLLFFILIEPSYEVLFTTIVMIFGLIFMIAITPMSPPDEQLHYENCLQLSNYVLGKGDTHQYVEVEYARDAYFGGHYNTCMAYIRFMKEFNEPLELSGEYKECLTDVEGSYPIYYIPQVLGILVGKALNLNMLKLFYTGRLFNLIFYAICIYIAIKNTPSHKVLFGTIASLPIFIQQISSYSYDSFINGLCFIEISFFLKWLNTNEIIKIKDFILTFLVCLGLAPAKIVYSLISLLFIFIPYDRFGDKKKKVICVIILCLPSFFVVTYNIYIRIIDYIVSIFTVNADIISDSTNLEKEIGKNKWNISRCLNHPKEVALIFLRTIRYGIKKWFYDAVSYTLSGQSMLLPLSLTYVFIFNILFSAVNKSNYIMPIRIKLFSLALCIIVGFLILFGMLTGWTSRHSNVINGVQGRYFCPILPYFFSIFANKKFGFSSKINKYIIYTQILAFYEVLLFVLSYTFVN